MFDHTLLEDDQRELLIVLAEAVRRIARDQKQKFVLVETIGGGFLRGASGSSRR